MLDLKKILLKNKEILYSENMKDEDFLGKGLFEKVWNSEGYLIENVGVEFIVETLRNKSPLSDEDKVRIFDNVMNEWMEEVYRILNKRTINNG